MKRIISVLGCCLLLSGSFVFGQEIRWKAGAYTFFDNQEYFNDYIIPQSMLGVRTFAQGGLAVDDYSEFYVGLGFTYENGAEVQKKLFRPLMYYHYNKKPFEVYMGAFNRRGTVDLPFVLQTDSFQYYRPNVEGIFIRAYKPWGKQELWLDWTSRQTDTIRETFLIGGTGKVWKGAFFARYDFIMRHYAGPGIPIPHDHIRDNGGLDIVAGLDLSHKTFLDTLTVSTGMTMSYDRIRNMYDLSYRFGSLTEIYALYKGVGIRNTLYMGEGQVQTVGDGMYKAKFYDRLDFIVHVFQKSRVDASAQFSLHFLPDAVMNTSQKFSVYVDLDGSRKINLKKDN
jgi:hypothetical protein